MSEQASAREDLNYTGAHALVTARETGTGTVLVHIGGRGDKAMDHVIENWGIGQDS